MSMQGYPLSPQQGRIASIKQAYPISLSGVSCALTVHGNISLSRLRKAFEACVAMHSALRARLVRPTGLSTMLQVIDPDPSSDICVIDLHELTQDVQERVINRLQLSLHQARFNTVERPRVCMLILLCRSREITVAISVNSLHSDVTGLDFVIQYIVERLNAVGSCVSPEFIPQYIQAAEWQNQIYDWPVAEPGIQYWKGRDFRPLLAQRFGLEQSSNESPCANVGVWKRVIMTDQFQRLTLFANNAGVDVTDLVLLAWILLIQRHCDCQRVLIGVACNGRTTPELQKIIGPLLKYLPVTMVIDQGVTVRQLLVSLLSVLAEARDWQELFDWGRQGGVAETGHGMPLLIPYLYEALSADGPRVVDGVQVRVMHRIEIAEPFSLKLQVIPLVQSLDLRLWYDSKIFAADSVNEVGMQVIDLLNTLMDSFDQPIHSLQWFGTVSDRYLESPLISSTSPNFTEHDLVYQQIDRWAVRTPHKVAIRSFESVLTYAALKCASDVLAENLLVRGVTPGSCVGVALERSTDLVIAVLAIMKAGAAFLPLRVDDPPDRLREMLKNARVKIAIATRSSVQKFAELSICVISPSHGADTHMAEDCFPGKAMQLHQLAYITYTSGSTGKPKAVMIHHFALCAHMDWMAKAFPLKENDNVFLKTQFSFDAAIWELFAPLTAGATLCVGGVNAHIDMAEVVQSVRRWCVTRIQFVPTVLRIFVEEPGSDQCTSLRDIFCGGERLTRDVVQACWKRLPTAKVHNLYGPTETCIDVAAFTCYETMPHRYSVPIGRPILGSQIYILDANFDPVPIGVTGELFIGGNSVGRGYMGDPAFTAERFMPDPFSVRPGAQLYRSRDMARMLPNGLVEFVGRNDDQIKVHGQRIEPVEIERALRGIPEIIDCAVVAKSILENRIELAAYVELRHDYSTNSQGSTRTDAIEYASDEQVGAWRNVLSQSLPDYMLPTRYFLIGRLPTTEHGKIERRVLQAAPFPERHKPENALPRTDTEIAVAAIWEEVLDGRTVGVDQDFFELGGYSLLLTQVLSRIRLHFDIDISLRTLFEARTVARFAHAIDQQRAERSKGSSIDAESVPRMPGSEKGING